jgi:hypothetical protein
MSNETIKAIWLTIERVAELKGCSNRTVWRYITGQRMLTHKQLVKSGQRKVCKTFVLTNPEIYDLEIRDCETRGVTPSEYLEAQIEVDGRTITGSNVYGMLRWFMQKMEDRMSFYMSHHRVKPVLQYHYNGQDSGRKNELMYRHHAGASVESAETQNQINRLENESSIEQPIRLRGGL